MLLPHLRYAIYVLRHKWYVLIGGLRFKVPLWQLIVHDLSKFRPSEWFAYVCHFYGPNGIADQKIRKHEAGSDPEFDEAWRRHYKRNPHHWEYWVWEAVSPSGVTSPLTDAVDMPERYVREMLADWFGASRAQGFKDFPAWYYKNRAKIKLHPETRRLVEDLLREYRGHYIPKLLEVR